MVLPVTLSAWGSNIICRLQFGTPRVQLPHQTGMSACQKCSRSFAVRIWTRFCVGKSAFFLMSICCLLLYFNVLRTFWVVKVILQENIKFIFLYKFFFYFFFNVYLFLGQRETENEWGRGRERGRHRIGNISRLRAISPEPDAGLELTDREIGTWLKSDA